MVRPGRSRGCGGSHWRVHEVLSSASGRLVGRRLLGAKREEKTAASVRFRQSAQEMFWSTMSTHYVVRQSKCHCLLLALALTDESHRMTRRSQGLHFASGFIGPAAGPGADEVLQSRSYRVPFQRGKAASRPTSSAGTNYPSTADALYIRAIVEGPFTVPTTRYAMFLLRGWRLGIRTPFIADDGGMLRLSRTGRL
jgi:hypothetical protein